MKIGIICSSITDLHLFNLLNLYNHDYMIFLDDRFGPWGQMSWEGALQRLCAILDTDEVLGCNKIILPPIFELYYLHNPATTHDIGSFGSKESDKSRIVPLFTEYVLQCVLPGSAVGKIGLVGYQSRQYIADQCRSQLIRDYVLTANQLRNRHFQKSFPLYKIATDHWSILYDLPRARFINKLIKIDLKKLKDYAIDTLLPLEYGYFRYQKTFLDAFHNSVKFHKQHELGAIVGGLMKDNQNQYDVSVYYTGSLETLEKNKNVMRLLGRGVSTAIGKHLVSIQ